MYPQKDGMIHTLQIEIKMQMKFTVFSLTCTAAFTAGFVQAAEEYSHEQLPYEAPVVVPFDSTRFEISDRIPAACRNEKVEALIRDLEAGKITFQTIAADETIPQDSRYCKTLDDNGQIHECKDCDVKNSPVGYFWKEISDWPVTIGITDGVPGDHEPHFHPQSECYYIVKGQTKFLVNNHYEDLKKGQYAYIPGNTIHNIPSFHGVTNLYWYPKDGHFAGFHYYWRKDVKNLRAAREAFDRVDEYRKRDLGLGKYGTNADKFPKTVQEP